MKRVILAAVALGLLGGCGLFDGDGKPTRPTLGKRIPDLSAETSIEVDPALDDVAITLPPATANAEWAQPGGNAAQAKGTLPLGGSERQSSGKGKQVSGRGNFGMIPTPQKK